MDNKSIDLNKVKKENDAFTKAIRKLIGMVGIQQDQLVQEEKKDKKYNIK